LNNNTKSNRGKSKRYVKYKPRFPKFPKEKYHKISDGEIEIIVNHLKSIQGLLLDNEPVRAWCISCDLLDFLDRFGGSRYR